MATSSGSAEGSKTTTDRGRSRGTTWERFCALAAELPGVERGTCYGTPALYVRKKFLARLKEDGDSVAIKVDFTDRDVLLEAEPKAFYLTDHYRPYPAVLMRLSQVRPAMAMELLEQAWRRAAPKSLSAGREPGPRGPRGSHTSRGRRRREASRTSR
jgi:hypothetical protein